MDNFCDYNENPSLYKTMNCFKGKREAQILLSVSAMLVFFGLVLGVILYRIVSDDIILNTDRLVGRYFNSMFEQAGSLGGKIKLIISAFLHELVLPSIVFAFGYTVFSPIFSSAVCVWKSALCSFAICMLEFNTLSGVFVESLLYLIMQIAIISVNVSVGMRAYVFSTKFHSEKSDITDIFKRTNSRSYICDFIISAGVLFVAVAGAIIIINLI